MNAQQSTVEEALSTMRKTTNKKRSLGGVKLAERAKDSLHLELFLRCLCPETAVAEEARQLHHVRRVEAHIRLKSGLGFPRLDSCGKSLAS